MTKLSSYQKLKVEIETLKNKVNQKDLHIYALIRKPDEIATEKLKMFYETKFAVNDSLWMGDSGEVLEKSTGLHCQIVKEKEN